MRHEIVLFKHPLDAELCDGDEGCWEPCGCGNQPPMHCMHCARDLTLEQVTTLLLEVYADKGMSLLAQPMPDSSA